MTLQSLLNYPDLVGQSQENIFVQKILYDPKNEVSEAIKRKSVKDPNTTPELIQQIGTLLIGLTKLSTELIPFNRY